jgi:hypothetical protein
MTKQMNSINPESKKTLSLLTEDLISFNEVPPMLQMRVHVSTIWRWANRGIGGVKLETIKLGGKTLTTSQAVTRFIRKTSRN